MLLKADKNKLRQKLISEPNTNIHGKAEHPRLKVFFRSPYIYTQVIDDDKGVTLTEVSFHIKFLNSATAIRAAAKYVGTLIAKGALDAGITEVVFDSGGCIFKGFAKVLAEAAREAGLKF